MVTPNISAIWPEPVRARSANYPWSDRYGQLFRPSEEFEEC